MMRFLRYLGANMLFGLAVALLVVAFRWVFPLEPTVVGVPTFNRPVTDLTATLDAAWISALEQRLLELQQRRGAQIAVLMVPTTGEQSIEQYADQVFQQWQLGRKGVDDGVLILIAKGSRRVRIEVGYGLEGVITDVLAGEIIRERMAPAFRSRDYERGITATVDALIGLVEGGELPEPAAASYGPAWLALGVFIFGGVIGVLLVTGRLPWQWAAGVLGGVTFLSIVFLKGVPEILFPPVSLIVGGVLCGLVWSERAALYHLLRAALVLAAYIALIVFLEPRFGFPVLLFGVFIPVGVLIGGLVLWLIFVGGGSSKGRGNRKRRRNRSSSSSTSSSSSSSGGSTGGGGSSGGGGASGGW